MILYSGNPSKKRGKKRKRGMAKAYRTASYGLSSSVQMVHSFCTELYILCCVTTSLTIMYLHVIFLYSFKLHCYRCGESLGMRLYIAYVHNAKLKTN